MVHPLAKDFDELYDAGLKISEMTDNLGRRPRFYNLTQIFNLSRPVKGDTVEIGCFRGLSSYLLCHLMNRSSPDFTGATHHLIDSFEGLSDPVEADELLPDVKGRFSMTSVEHVRRTLAEFPEVKIYKGWVPDVFRELPDRDYRFVHIDVDLYEPTRDCLHFFYPRLNSGGIIVVDDFGPWPRGGRYPGCSKAVMEFCQAQNLSVAALTTGNALIVKSY